MYSSRQWFLAVTVLVAVAALWEYLDLTLPDGDISGKLLILVIGGFLPILVSLKGIIVLPLFFSSALFVILLYRLFSSGQIASANKFSGAAISGLLYIPFLLSYMVMLRSAERGKLWLFFVFAVIWGNDTFAYYTGRRFGRHKLAKVISPGKTVEGSIGGFLGGVIAGLLFNYFVFINVGVVNMVILSLMMAFTGQVGDLVESMIKRSAGVKDSGFIIPGHGGILDRIDSILLSLPLLYYYLDFSRGIL